MEDVIDQSLEVVKVKRFEENELFRKFTKYVQVSLFYTFL